MNRKLAIRGRHHGGRQLRRPGGGGQVAASCLIRHPRQLDPKSLRVRLEGVPILPGRSDGEKKNGREHGLATPRVLRSETWKVQSAMCNKCEGEPARMQALIDAYRLIVSPLTPVLYHPPELGRARRSSRSRAADVLTERATSYPDTTSPSRFRAQHDPPHLGTPSWPAIRPRLPTE